MSTLHAQRRPCYNNADVAKAADVSVIIQDSVNHSYCAMPAMKAYDAALKVNHIYLFPCRVRPSSVRSTSVTRGSTSRSKNNVRWALTLAMHRDKVVGHAQLERTTQWGRVWELSTVAVLPCLRGMSVCSSLVDGIAAWATRHPVAKVTATNIGGLSGRNCYKKAFEKHGWSVSVQETDDGDLMEFTSPTASLATPVNTHDASNVTAFARYGRTTYGSKPRGRSASVARG